MTKAPLVPPSTTAPELQRTDRDAAALRRAVALIQRDGWWNGQGFPLRGGRHCIVTAIRHNEGALRYLKVVHRLHKDLGMGVRGWNDTRGRVEPVISRLEALADQWDRD